MNPSLPPIFPLCIKKYAIRCVILTLKRDSDRQALLSSFATRAELLSGRPVPANYSPVTPCGW
jgi:hypothetical protein